MKITATQLRKIIAEEVRDKYGMRVDDAPLLELFDVDSFEDITDEQLDLVIGAAAAAKVVKANRRDDFVKKTPLGQRLKPVDAEVIFRSTRTTPAEAKKNGLVKFFVDGNSYYAETATGMLWKAGAYEKLKPTGKATVDFKAAKKG